MHIRQDHKDQITTMEQEYQISPPAALRSSGIAAAGRILGRGLGYLTQIILAHILAPDGYGLFAIGWTILRLFTIAGHLGLDYGITKFGARYKEKDPKRFGSVIILSIGGAFLSGLTLGLLLNLSAPWLAETAFRKPELEPIFQGIALAFPFATTLRVQAAICVLQGKTLYGAAVEDIAQPVIQIILFALLLTKYDGTSSAVASAVISYAASTILGFIVVSYLTPALFWLKNFTPRDLRPLLKYSLPAIAGAALGAFNLWGDRILVGRFGTEADTGIYQSISIITMLTTTILSGMKISAAPVIAKLHHEGRRADIVALAKSMSRWSLYAGMPILVFVAMNSGGVIAVFFGVDYLTGSLPLLILTLGQSAYIMLGVADQVLLMTEKQKVWLAISLVIFAMTIFLDTRFIPQFGLVGASVVSTVMVFLLCAISILYLRYYLRCWLLDKSHAKILFTAVCSGLITYPAISRLSFGLIPNMILSFAGITGSFIILLWGFGMDARDKAQLKKMFATGKPRSPG